MSPVQPGSGRLLQSRRLVKQVSAGGLQEAAICLQAQIQQKTVQISTTPRRRSNSMLSKETYDLAFVCMSGRKGVETAWEHVRIG